MSLNVQPGIRASDAVKPASAPIQGKTSPTTTAAADGKNGGDEFSFWDLVDIVNPLQQIPVVGTIYRAVTGDKLSNFSRIAGGALYGGVAGAALGLVNTVAVVETGSDLGQMALAKMGFGAAEGNKNVPTGTGEDGGEGGVPVIEVHPLAEAKSNAAGADVVAALPEAEPLNDIAPVAGFSQNVDEKQVPTAMMDALLKYQEMQNKAAVDTITEAKDNAAADNTAFADKPRYLRDQLSPDRRIATR